MKDNLIVKSNQIIQASYTLTVNEQRLLLACISQIDSRPDADFDAKNGITLTVEEAQDLFYSEKERKNAYRDLRNASESLYRREIKLIKTNEQYTLTRWVSSVDIDGESMTVTLYFHNQIKPYISQLHENYTQYRLENIVQLTSSYAIRIYELIVSWSFNSSFKQMEISEFRELLDIGSKYKAHKDFNKRVIVPALEQINEYTDFELDIAFKKSKRAYRWIQLRFNKKADAKVKEETEKLARKEQREHNQRAKQKRLQQEEIKARQEFAKSVDYPPDGTFILINGTFAQMEGKTAVYKGDNDSRYTIPEAIILKAIKDSKLEIVSPDDEALQPYLDDKGNLDLFGF